MKTVSAHGSTGEAHIRVVNKIVSMIISCLGNCAELTWDIITPGSQSKSTMGIPTRGLHSNEPQIVNK